MKINDIRKLSDKELNDKIVESKRTLFDLLVCAGTSSCSKINSLLPFSNSSISFYNSILHLHLALFQVIIALKEYKFD